MINFTAVHFTNYTPKLKENAELKKKKKTKNRFFMRTRQLQVSKTVKLQERNSNNKKQQWKQNYTETSEYANYRNRN